MGKKRNSGIPTIELAIRFADWANARSTFPTPTQIQDRFNVHPTTAYRWRSALAAARNITAPRIELGMGQGGVR